MRFCPIGHSVAGHYLKFELFRAAAWPADCLLLAHRLQLSAEMAWGE
jgi:hypothetical protein